MKPLVALLCLTALALGLTPTNWHYELTKTEKMSAGVNWRVFRVDQWWPQSGNAERVEALCVASAWAGTATVFALAPWHNNTKVMRWIQVAAVAGVGGLLGGYVVGGLRQKYER